MNSLVAGVASNYLLFSPAITIVQVSAGLRIRQIAPTLRTTPWPVQMPCKRANMQHSFLDLPCESQGVLTRQLMLSVYEDVRNSQAGYAAYYDESE
jgi:hypothetical protein